MSALSDAHQYLDKKIQLEKEEKPDSLVHISAFKVDESPTKSIEEEIEKKKTESDEETSVTKSKLKIKKRRSINQSQTEDTTKQRSSRLPTIDAANNVNTQAMSHQNSANTNITSTHVHAPTQSAPMQTFSFMRCTINVDTLVRLFILAMICLMVINAMLYYKLRRIETLADGLRNDPQIMERYNRHSSEAVYTEKNMLNRDLLSREINNWKEIIANTLKTIEKMGNALKDFNQVQVLGNYATSTLNKDGEL